MVGIGLELGVRAGLGEGVVVTVAEVLAGAELADKTAWVGDTKLTA